MSVDDVYRLSVEWSNTPGFPTAVNLFYFKQIDALVLDTPGEDLVEAFRTECEATYRELVTNALALRKYAVAKAPLFLTEHVLEGLGEGGLATGDAMPPNTGGLLSIKTATLTRRGRGRVFIPPASETYNSGGRPTALMRGNITAFGSFMMVEMNTTTLAHSAWEMQMWSKADQVARPVVSAFSSAIWGSQRDRRYLY